MVADHEGGGRQTGMKLAVGVSCGVAQTTQHISGGGRMSSPSRTAADMPIFADVNCTRCPAATTFQELTG
jgi:hypothetical protein